MTSSQHVYEVRPRKDHRGVHLISDALRARIVFDCRMANDSARILATNLTHV